MKRKKIAMNKVKVNRNQAMNLVNCLLEIDPKLWTGRFSDSFMLITTCNAIILANDYFSDDEFPIITGRELSDDTLEMIENKRKYNNNDFTEFKTSLQKFRSWSNSGATINRDGPVYWRYSYDLIPGQINNIHMNKMLLRSILPSFCTDENISLYFDISDAGSSVVACGEGWGAIAMSLRPGMLEQIENLDTYTDYYSVSGAKKTFSNIVAGMNCSYCGLFYSCVTANRDNNNYVCYNCR